MPRKRGERRSSASLGRTKIACIRNNNGVDQVELARVTGIAVRTLQDIESGRITNPRIRHLVNIAAALDVELLDVCEPEWLTPIKLYAQRSTAPIGDVPVVLAERELGRFLPFDI
jgi:transcriptional regulator with XRE-family HTH domain